MAETTDFDQPGRSCPNCGSEIRQGNVFCTSCGANLVPDNEASEQTYAETTPEGVTGEGGRDVEGAVSHEPGDERGSHSSPGLGRRRVLTGYADRLSGWFQREIVGGGARPEDSLHDRAGGGRVGVGPGDLLRGMSGNLLRWFGTLSGASKRVVAGLIVIAVLGLLVLLSPLVLLVAAVAFAVSVTVLIYVFELSFLKEPYKVHREVWEQVCTSYSRIGANMTKAQVATEFNIPRQILEACLERYGFYKSSPPYTHEDLKAAEDVEELFDQTLEQRQHRFHTRLQNKELDFLRREVERLWEEKHDRDRLIENALEGAIEGIREAGKAKAKPPGKPRGGRLWVAHCPVADLHIGKFVWDREDFGSDYDLEESTRRLVEHGEEVARWIQDRQGHCTDAFLTDIGDFIHAHNSQTESGTPLHQDSRDKKVFEEALQAKIRQIEAVRPHVDTVHVHAAPGNHAGYVDWVVTKVLSVHYRDCPEVVVSDNVRPYDHFLIGQSLIVLDHGKGVNALTGWKAKASLDVIARTVAGDDFFSASKIYYFVGHLHELQAASHGEHAKLIRLPSFGESDEYETSLRYASEPVAHLFAHDGVSGRIIGDEWAYLETPAGARPEDLE